MPASFNFDGNEIKTTIYCFHINNTKNQLRTISDLPVPETIIFIKSKA